MDVKTLEQGIEIKRQMDAIAVGIQDYEKEARFGIQIVVEEIDSRGQLLKINSKLYPSLSAEIAEKVLDTYKARYNQLKGQLDAL